MIQLDLSGKVALIAGVQNEHSLAWPAAKKLMEAGCKCIFSFQGDRNRPALEKLTEAYKDRVLMLEVCDVTVDADLEKLFAKIGADVGKIDYLMHAIAFAPRPAMENAFIKTNREDWKVAMDISAYSLVALSQHAEPVMRDGGSIVCLTYYASEKVVAKYNVMGIAKSALEAVTRYLAYDLGPRGIRVNAVSPGPMRTVAPSGNT